MMMEEGSGGGGRGGKGEEREKRRGKCCGWRMLEVGALRVDNAAARSGLFATVERIDLHAQERGIVTQDFMERPLPAVAEEEGFDVVSLSLVLNYVGDAKARGEMLRRVEWFLRKRGKRRKKWRDDGDERAKEEEKQTNEQDGCCCQRRWFPGLFLVLPAPCVTNSRYLDEERLEAMIRGLGYVRAKRKLSLKLIYYFWRWVGGTEAGEGVEWGGREVAGGVDGREVEGRVDGREAEGEMETKLEETNPVPQPSPTRSRTQSQPRLQTPWPKTPLQTRKGPQRNNFAIIFK